MISYKMPHKDPVARLDYAVDFAAWLEGRTITSYTISATGATLDAHALSGDVVHFWLSGGLDGDTATVRIEVTCSDGAVDARTVGIPIRKR